MSLTKILKTKSEIIQDIVIFLDQRDKYNFARCNKALYPLVLPHLYYKIVIILLNNSKGLSSLRSEFIYPNNQTVLSNHSSICKFFKTINKIKYDCMIHYRFTTDLRSFSVIQLNDELQLFKSHSFPTLTTINELNNNQIDCLNPTMNEYQIFINKSILKLLTNLRSACVEFYIPNFIYSNLLNYKKIQIKAKESHYRIDKILGYTSYKKYGNALALCLDRLTHLSISFADPSITKRILKCCNHRNLKKLSLYHITCPSKRLNTDKLVDGLDETKKVLKQYELFFRDAKIQNLFHELKDLEFVFHDGYNRFLFNMFLKSMKHNLVGKYGTKLNKLQSFNVYEIVSSKYYQIPQVNNYTDGDLITLNKFDTEKCCSMFLIIDLLKNQRQDCSILDIIDFTKLKQFHVSLNCQTHRSRYFNFLSFKHHFVNRFAKEIKRVLITNRTLDFKLLVEPYDKRMMIPKRVVIAQ